MKVICYDSEFDVPDFVVDRFISDFKGLAGGKNRESVLQLRNTIEEIVDAVAQDPEMLHETHYLSEFIRAIAMQQALKHHGLLYDA